jgi:hypothetical protein
MLVMDRVCDRCGQRLAKFHPLTVIGALTLAEQHFCPSCMAEDDAESVRRGVPPEGDLAHLGPIQFPTLLKSMLTAEKHESAPTLRGYEALVRQVAEAHNQPIPDDVTALFERWRAQ